MKLNEIRDMASALPTIMGISNELQVIKELMSVSPIEIVEQKKIFYSIVFDVHLSFTDTGFMELTEELEGEFIRFSCWLNKVKVDLGMKLSDNIIKDFSLTAGDVKRMLTQNM